MRALLEMKQRVYFQEQDLNIRSQDLNQPVASRLEFPRSGQRLDEQKPQKTMGIHNWTRTGKGTYVRTLYQKNNGSAEVKDG
jgi:hypothetical protein